MHCAFHPGLKFKAAILTDRFFRPAPTVFPLFFFFAPAYFPCWLIVFQVFSKVYIFSFPVLHRLPAFCHQCHRSTFVFVVTVDVVSKSCTAFVPPQNFCVVQLARFSSFLPLGALPHVRFCFCEGNSKLVVKLFPVFFSFLFVWSCLFKYCEQFSFSFCTLSAALGPRVFLFVQERVEHFIICRRLPSTFFLSFACSQVFTKLCSPLFPRVAVTLFSWCHTTLYFSPYHVSLS